jgi:hypothetical protein
MQAGPAAGATGPHEFGTSAAHRNARDRRSPPLPDQLGRVVACSRSTESSALSIAPA